MNPIASQCLHYQAIFNSKFCPDCGEKLPEQKNCGCGSYLPNFYKFCDNCGKPAL